MLALVLAALVSWHSRVNTIPEDTLRPWAEAIASVCESRRECLELAALAEVETHFASWVLDGSCNSAAWRKTHPRYPSCDGGLASGPWQLHLVELGVSATTPLEHAQAALKLWRRASNLWTTKRQAVALAKTVRD